MTFPVGDLSLSHLIGSPETGRLQLMRAVDEGLAFGLRQNLDQIRSVAAAGPPLRLGGGMSRSRSFSELVASVLGEPVERTRWPESSAAGAALCAGIGAGVFDDLEDACRALPDPERIEPVGVAASVYAESYPAWVEWRAGWLLPGPADSRARDPARHQLERRGARRWTGAANAREHRRGDGALPGRRAVLPGVHAPPGAAERRKKRIRALCRWHFQPGGGPEYCRACRDDDLPCARGEPGADGRNCPYREHTLISAQEHEAWDVLLACQGQIRLAPSGHVIGIEMDAALWLATARGHDLRVLSELLSAAEAGLVQELCADPVRRSGG
jgi:hypothetical protein